MRRSAPPTGLTGGLAGRPRPGAAALPARPVATPGAPLLEVRGLVKELPAPDGFLARLAGRAEDGRPLRAVDGIGFTLRRGECLGLLGEAGSGASVAALLVARLLDPTAGSIRFDGREIGGIPARGFARLPLRPRIQRIAQDPAEGLHPHRTALHALADPLLHRGGVPREALRARCEALAATVGLDPALLGRLPHQLRPAQRARLGLARSLASEPELLVLDEPVAALEAPARAVVLDLLGTLRHRLGFGCLLADRDPRVLRRLCDRLLVLRAGRVVERGPAARVLDSPRGAHTRGLLAASPPAPVPERDRRGHESRDETKG